MKKIFFFARDPGGLNAVFPVYKEIKNFFEPLIYAKDFALQRLRAEGIPVIDIDQECLMEEEEIYHFLKRVNPHAIVTGTSLDDYTERYLWKAAERLHIKSYAILDQWMNLGIRFSEYTYAEEELYKKYHEHCYLPYRVLVMDELARRMLIEDGVDGNRIVVTGQPHFETVYAKYQQVSGVYDEKYWNVVFVSEPISNDYDRNNKEKLYWGYNEKTVFQQLYDCLLRQADFLPKDIRLIIRPHPREDINSWKEIVQTLNSKHITIELDAQNGSFAILKSADIVCGMSSMFLLEAVICEKPILSIEIGLCRENPFVLDKAGICHSVLTEEDLSLQLMQMFKRLQGTEKKEMLEFKFVENAVENIISVIQKEIDK